jgi:hypothetical protein
MTNRRRRHCIAAFAIIAAPQAISDSVFLAIKSNSQVLAWFEVNYTPNEVSFTLLAIPCHSLASIPAC